MKPEKPKRTYIDALNYTEEHPAYGCLSVNQSFRSHRDATMVGSAVPHRKIISFTLRYAQRSRTADRDEFVPREVIAEWVMTGAQFAALVSQTADGWSGVPVTLEVAARGEPNRLPGVEYVEENTTDEVLAQALAEVDRLGAEVRNAFASTLAEVGRRLEGVSKKKQAEVTDPLQALRNSTLGVASYIRSVREALLYMAEQARTEAELSKPVVAAAVGDEETLREEIYRIMVMALQAQGARCQVRSITGAQCTRPFHDQTTDFHCHFEDGSPQRGPGGAISNCEWAFGGSPEGCQICAGSTCPDKAFFESGGQYPLPPMKDWSL